MAPRYGIQFYPCGQIYYFTSPDTVLTPGTPVVVDTGHGENLGTVVKVVGLRPEGGVSASSASSASAGEESRSLDAAVPESAWSEGPPVRAHEAGGDESEGGGSGGTDSGTAADSGEDLLAAGNGDAAQALEEVGGREEADSEGLEPRVLALEGMAVATSGDRWHAYAQDGHSYSHTIDPRSGEPVTDAAAAVTVIAADAMHADAWATALTVMGTEEGPAFAAHHGLAARFLQRTGEGLRETMTPAFEQHLAA